MAKGSDNPFPSMILTPGSAPASPSAGQQRLYLDSGDSNKLKRKDSSGTVVSLESAAGGGETVAAVSATGTGTASTFEIVDASGGAITRTTPAHAAGAIYSVKKGDTSANVITISPASGTIDGQASYKLYIQGAGVTLISDGTNWYVSREVDSAWVSYTPTLTNGTLGNGTLAGRCRQIGRDIHFDARFTLGSTSAVAANFSMALPFTAATTANNEPGSVLVKVFDTSAGTYKYGGPLGSFSAAALVTLSIDSQNGACTATVPWTWATGDFAQMTGIYTPA